VGSGKNHTVTGSTIKAANGFYGTLSIPVIYKDDRGFTTNSYNFTITVKYSGAVATPTMESVPTAAELNNKISIHWTRDDPINYYILKRNLNGGDWNTGGVGYNLTNSAEPILSEFGTHCFKVIATFEGRWSGFSNQVCTYVGNKGAVVNQQPVILSTGNSYIFSASSVTISDHDSSSHSVYSVAPGSNYSVSGSTVTPSNDFIGTISVPVEYVDNNGTVTYKYDFKIDVNVEAKFSSQASFDLQWNYHSTACQDITDITLGEEEPCFRRGSLAYWTKDAVEIVDNSAFIKVNAKETTDPQVGLLSCSADQLSLSAEVTNRNNRYYVLTSGYIISKAKVKFGKFEAGISYQRVYGTQSAMWVDSDWVTPVAGKGQEIDVDEYIPRIDRWHQSHQFTVHSHDEERYVKCNGVGGSKTCFTRGSDPTDEDNGAYYLDLEAQKAADAFTHNHTFALDWNNEDVTYTLTRDGLEKGTYTHQDLIDHTWETDPNKISKNAGIYIEPDAAYLKFSIEVGKNFYGIKTDQNGDILDDKRRLCSVIGSILNEDGTLGTSSNREVTLGGMKVDYANIHP